MGCGSVVHSKTDDEFMMSYGKIVEPRRMVRIMIFDNLKVILCK